MQRHSSRIGFASVAAIAALSLSAGMASAADESARTLSSADIQQQFVRCGFVLEGGSSGQFFSVQDPRSIRGRDARVLMVQVYPDPEAATVAHERAHALAEERAERRRPLDEDHGPQLLVAYGGSVWRHNVSLVQSSLRDLGSIWYVDEQTGEAGLMRSDVFDLGFVSRSGPYAVDPDFVACLERMPASPVLAQQTFDAPAAIMLPLLNGIA